MTQTAVRTTIQHMPRSEVRKVYALSKPRAMWLIALYAQCGRCGANDRRCMAEPIAHSIGNASAHPIE